MAEVESLPFSYSHSGICLPRLIFNKFFQEVRFCIAKAYFIVNDSAKPEAFRRYKENKFNQDEIRKNRKVLARTACGSPEP